MRALPFLGLDGCLLFPVAFPFHTDTLTLYQLIYSCPVFLEGQRSWEPWGSSPGSTTYQAPTPGWLLTAVSEPAPVTWEQRW